MEFKIPFSGRAHAYREDECQGNTTGQHYRSYNRPLPLRVFELFNTTPLVMLPSPLIAFETKNKWHRNVN